MRPLLLLALLAARPAFADGPLPLKPGPGAEQTAAACNTCHTSNYIIMNSTFLRPTQWAAEVARMRSVFGAPIDDAAQAAISAYLGASYALPPKP